MFGRLPSISALMAAMAMIGSAGALATPPKATLAVVNHDYRRIERDPFRLRRRTNPHHPAANGKRETARRQQQIAAGSLKEANGLCRRTST